jgi:hypothetical protein
MRLWKRWKRKLQLIFNPTTRQIAAAIRLGEAKERNRAKREAQAKPYVWIDPAVRQRGYEQSAWNSPPEKRTDPAVEAQRRKQEEMKAFLGVESQELPRIPGDLTRTYKTRKLNRDTRPRNMSFARLVPDESFLL